MLRGRDVDEVRQLHRHGVSISEIRRRTGLSRDTIRKYLRETPEGAPHYGPRSVRGSKLDPFKEYLETRRRAGVWNAVVLLRELRERGYTGGYTLVKEYLEPLRGSARAGAVRRFETAPGQQAQFDWGDLGYLERGGERHKLYAFVMTLGYSRAVFAEVATHQRLDTLLRLHEQAFWALGGVCEEILYDWMKTVALGRDDRDEIRWNPAFADFARHWGFQPRLCREYRPQTKGKVESGVGYLKRNFLPEVIGWETGTEAEVSGALRGWVETVANRRVHGTTHRRVEEAWAEERPHLAPIGGRPAYPYRPMTLRRVSRDAYVSYGASRYSAPWETAGRDVQVREVEDRLEFALETSPGILERIAVHARSERKHAVITEPSHHAGIPLGDSKAASAGRLHLKAGAPSVEVRPLEEYERYARGPSNERHPNERHPNERHPNERHPNERHPNERHPNERHPNPFKGEPVPSEGSPR